MSDNPVRDPLVDPKPGDILRLYSDEYEVLIVDDANIIDKCLKGSDAGATLTNPRHEWLKAMSSAEVIHCAD